MSDITVLGAGAGGMIAAALLAKDGHRVTVLERDPRDPPESDEGAWEQWSRPGINQLRQPHGYLGWLRATIEDELPALWSATRRVHPVPLPLKPLSPEPDAAAEPNDDGLMWECMRRTTFDRILAEVVGEISEIDVRRGTAAQSLVWGNSDSRGLPHVSGVETESGEVVLSDLVVDAMGRRTPVGRWLEHCGVGVSATSEADGFTYFTRWFQRKDGAHPDHVIGGLSGMMPGLIFLLFPSENGTFAVAAVGSIRDKPLRKMKNPDVYLDVTLASSEASKWVDPAVSVPTTDVMPMGSIQNRQLRFAVDDEVSVTGIVNIGDSAISTNPSLGRGIPLATKYALTLRQVLRDAQAPDAIATEFDKAKEADLTPWLYDAIESDAGLRRMFTRMVDGPDAVGTVESDRAVFQRAAMVDMECWRAWTRMGQCFSSPLEVLSDERLLTRAKEVAPDPQMPSTDLTRGQLLERLG